MSAVVALVERSERASGPARPMLRALERRPARLSTIAFVVLLVSLLGAGMVGILLLNVSIQQRARTLNALQATAEQKGYQQAALTSQVQSLRSPTTLQSKAWDLGLRPNTSPAFLVLPSGQVLGDTTAVTASEAPEQKYRSAQAITEAIEKANAAEIKRKADLIEAQKKRAAQRLAEQKAKAKAAAAAAKAKAAADAAKADAAKVDAAKVDTAKVDTAQTTSGGQ